MIVIMMMITIIIKSMGEAPLEAPSPVMWLEAALEWNVLAR